VGARAAHYNRSRLVGGDWAVVAVLLAVGIVVPALLAASGHAFAIARNDDWAYRRVLEHFASTGRYSLVGWGSMTLVGQVVWAAPFVVVLGHGAAVPGASVAVLSGAGLVAAYVLARRLLGPGRAALCCLFVLVLPGFALNTSSFMTDVPAFAAAAACLALGSMALGAGGGSRWSWLIASLAVGAFGFSIRQFDLAAPVAVLVVAAFLDRARLAGYALLGGGLLLLCGFTYWWANDLPGAQHKSVALPDVASMQTFAGSVFTLAFVLSPFLPALLRRSLSSGRALRPRALVVATCCLAVGIWLLAAHRPLLIGNYLTRTGAIDGEVLLGARPPVFSKPVWDFLDAIAFASAPLFIFAILNWDRRPRNTEARPPSELLVGAFLVLSAAGLIGYGLFVRAAFWDRYLWPVAFASALLLSASRSPSFVPDNGSRSRPGRQQGVLGNLAGPLAGGLALVTAVVAVAVTANSDSYDGARWSAGQDAVAAGYQPAMVDAGFEWVGSHQSGTAHPSGAGQASGVRTWYTAMFPGFKECAVVSSSPVGGPGLFLLRTVRYDELLFAQSERLYIYGKRSSGCPSATQKAQIGEAFR